MIEKEDSVFLERNIKGLMMTLLARWNAEMDATRAETEFADVRPADMRVFGQLRGRSLKLSEIHREMGFSRQAAQQAIERLVKHNMVAITPVPDSKRDKLVSITQQGHRWRTIAANQIRRIETDIGTAIGDDDKEALRDALIRLAAETQV